MSSNFRPIPGTRNRFPFTIFLLGIMFCALVILPASLAQAGTGNLLQNSTFESGSLSPWQKWVAAGAPGIVDVEFCCGNHTPGGTWNAYIEPRGQFVALYQSVSVIANKDYHLEAWVSTNGMTAYLDWWSNAGGGTRGNCGSTSAVWPTYVRLSCEFKVPPGTTNFNVQLNGNAPSGKWAVTDDLVLSQQPFHTGNQRTTGYGVKAIIYAPSGAPLTPTGGQYNWVSTAGSDGWVQAGWQYWPHNGDTQARAYTEAFSGGVYFGRNLQGTHCWSCGVWYRVEYNSSTGKWYAFIADTVRGEWTVNAPAGLQAMAEVWYDDAVQVSTSFSSVQYRATAGGSWTLFDQANWLEETPYRVNSKTYNYQWTSFGP